MYKRQDKGRIGYNPIMMYAVVTYANMRGVRAVDLSLIHIYAEREMAERLAIKYGSKNTDVISVPYRFFNNAFANPIAWNCKPDSIHSKKLWQHCQKQQ